MAVKATKGQISIQRIKEYIAKIDRRVLIQNSILTIALILFISIGFVPFFIQNQKTIKEVKDLQTMIRDATGRISKIPEMKKEKETLNLRAETVRHKFFETNEIDQLIEIISSTAQNTGIRVTASRPSSTEVKLNPPFDKLYTAVSYDLTIEGDYHQIGMFYNGLERYGKSLVIQNFYINGKESKTGVLQSNFELTAFIKRPLK